jgi:hypothetical protein
MTAGLAPTDSAPKASRLGPFEIRGRITDPAPPAGRIVLRVAGAPETPFAGREGIATCIAKPADDAALAKLTARLESLKAFRHPNLQPILDAGSAGNVLYWVSVKPAILSVADSLADSVMTPATTRQLVREVGSALSTLHAAQMTHGAVSANAIAQRPDGAFMLFAPGLSGKRTSDDQRDLATTVIQLLTGKPWTAPESTGDADMDGSLRSQSLRTAMPNITERLVSVLGKAVDLNPAVQYPSVGAFADAYEESVAYSAEDLAHGAFEAISASSPEIADLLYQRARDYDPSCELLTVLGIQLHGGSLFEMASASASAAQMPGLMQAQSMTMSAPPVPGLVLPPAAAPINPVTLIPAELTTGVPQEYLDAVAHQFAVEPVKPPRMNPMFIMILGGLGLIVLMLIAVLVTWSVS